MTNPRLDTQALTTSWALATRAGEFFVHVGTQHTYKILNDVLFIEKTMERGVLYQDVKSGVMFVRPYEEFFDGRFIQVRPIEETV